MGTRTSSVGGAQYGASVSICRTNAEESLPCLSPTSTEFAFTIASTVASAAMRPGWCWRMRSVPMWSPQIEAFASRFRVLRFDTRGLGCTDAPRGPYTVGQLTHDILALLDALSIERAAIRDAFAHMDSEGYACNCEAIGAADLSAELGAIHAPTLVITGSGDPSVAPELTRGLAERIAGARFVQLNAQHLSNVEQADEFTRTVLDFLPSSSPR